MLAMSWLPSLVILMLLHGSSASPFGGWGPGEGFGHLGKRPPPDNPNSNFGFDFFGTTHSRFNYSAVVMKHKEPISMRDPKFVSVAARIPHVHLHTETYLHSGPKRTTKKLIKHKSEIGLKNNRNFRIGKSLPVEKEKTSPPSKFKNTVIPTTWTKVSRTPVKNSNKFGIGLKNNRNFRRGKSLPVEKVKSSPPSKFRNKVIPTTRTKVSGTPVKNSNKFGKSRRRPKAGLTASDLWRLNRSNHQFTKTMGRPGRLGREGRRINNKVRKPDRKKHRRGPNKFKKKSKSRALNRRNGRFSGRGRG